MTRLHQANTFPPDETQHMQSPMPIACPIGSVTVDHARRKNAIGERQWKAAGVRQWLRGGGGIEGGGQENVDKVPITPIRLAGALGHAERYGKHGAFTPVSTPAPWRGLQIKPHGPEDRPGRAPILGFSISPPSGPRHFK